MQFTQKHMYIAAVAVAAIALFLLMSKPKLEDGSVDEKKHKSRKNFGMILLLVAAVVAYLGYRKHSGSLGSAEMPMSF